MVIDGDGNLRTIGAMAGLFVLWLLLSGLFKPLLIGLGAASAVFAVYVARRMDAQDGDRIDARISPIRTVKYLMWLMVEIAKANWMVTKIILSPSMPIRQHLFAVSFSQKTDLAQVIFANSITLTPGTITVSTEDGSFLVHAVAYTEDDPDALADMDRRATAIEWAGVT